MSHDPPAPFNVLIQRSPIGGWTVRVSIGGQHFYRWSKDETEAVMRAQELAGTLEALGFPMADLERTGT